MSATATTRFAAVVRARLIDNRLAGLKPDSIRGLARTMGRGDDSLAATYKRSLFKWMTVGGPRPSDVSRAIVAHALGNCDAGDLVEDDEESDLVADLYNVVRRLVRAEVAGAA